jgi:hypothetical protein
VTVPAVRPPRGFRRPIDLTLKAGWSFDPKTHAFTSSSGDTFSLRGQLPKGARVVHKVGSLSGSDASTLSAAERDLRRYLQVILPRGVSPAAHLPRVRAWPPVEEAHAAPDISLPGRS